MKTTILTLIGASVLAAAPPAYAESTAGWRFVRVFKSLETCHSAGRDLVARHQAREYRCDNDYDKAGVPVLDLYTR